MKILFTKREINSYEDKFKNFKVFNHISDLERCYLKKQDFVLVIAETEYVAEEVLQSIAFRCPSICVYEENIKSYKANEKFNNILFIPYSEFFSHDIDLTIKEFLKSFDKEDDEKIRLVGTSPAIQKVKSRIDKYARYDFPLHFSGNSGTGKNIAARRLHFLSGATGKFIYINCGTEKNLSMMLSNLFGHTKGAFTGSDSVRAGLLKKADKSTIFFDELEEMSLEMQAVLLDVIETGVFRPMGSDKEEKSSFRVLTASNIPIEELLETGKLRLDFYNRIAFREIHMPDLEERKMDVPSLVRDYELKNKIFKNRIKNYDALMSKTYKGNIRELYKEISFIHEEIEDKNLNRVIIN